MTRFPFRSRRSLPAGVAALAAAFLAVAVVLLAAPAVADGPIFDGAAAYRLVETQCHFGPRNPGSSGHKACLAWMEQELKRSGAAVIRGVPVGAVPATPARPQAPTGKDLVSELALLTVARVLGQPVGYAPEHGGGLVQNLVPTPDDVGRQTSTSSGVRLGFHTETAFHPHRPRYLLLLCLRGDPAGQTLLCSVPHAAATLPPLKRCQLLY